MPLTMPSLIPSVLLRRRFVTRFSAQTRVIRVHGLASRLSCGVLSQQTQLAEGCSQDISYTLLVFVSSHYVQGECEEERPPCQDEERNLLRDTENIIFLLQRCTIPPLSPISEPQLVLK